MVRGDPVLLMDDRDWPICCSLLDAESTGFGPKRLRCSVPPLFPIEHG